MKSSDLYILYLYHNVLFPNCSIFVKSSLKNTKKIKAGDKILAFPVRSIFDIIFYRNKIATIAKVDNFEIIDSNYSKIKLKGISRVRLKKVNKNRYAFYDNIEVDEGNPDKLKMMMDVLRRRTQELIFLINSKESDKLIYLLNFLTDSSQLTDFISNYFVTKFVKRFSLYNEINIEKRVRRLISILGKLTKRLKVKGELLQDEKEYS
ncbi:MAG: LON peptidase substrate-binding domain-containing protein [Spirochaetota bacterium]|nr:LON peptidase substrate-binding domain-containing protein [Spirochaetota bacterium]